MAVPRFIHQTFGSRDLPTELAESIAALQSQNPKWQYRFYDDADIEAFIARHEPAALEAFRSIDPRYGAARADLFRYIVVFHLGGVYLDIKSTFTRPLDDVLRSDDSYLLSYWPNQPGESYEGWGIRSSISDPRGEFQQCFLIAEPGHPYLRAVIDSVVANIEKYTPLRGRVGREGVLHLTGPIAYTHAVTPIQHYHPHRIVHSESDLGYVYSLYGAEDPLGHAELFDHHYEALVVPIVSGGLMTRVSGWLHVLARRVTWAARSLRR